MSSENPNSSNVDQNDLNSMLTTIKADVALLRDQASADEEQAQGKLRDQTNLLTTLQRQAYMQYDTILRLNYYKKYAISVMVLLFFVLITIIFGLTRIDMKYILGLIAFYLIVFFIVLGILLYSQNKRRRYSFTTRRFVVDEDEVDDKCD